MHLEEIKALPRKVIENLDGDIGNLKVYLVQDYNLNLTVDINNPAAISLYKDKLGFEIESFSKDEYGKGHDRYKMTLDLSKYTK
jgi:ribosomal protein S18 acetylase RimI-like enzyme